MAIDWGFIMEQESGKRDNNGNYRQDPLVGFVPNCTKKSVENKDNKSCYNKILARRVTGLTVPVVTSAVFIRIFRSSYHAWVEVYDDKLGWYSVDPTFCDGINSQRKYNTLPNLYVYQGIDEWSKGYSWRYWGNDQFNFKYDRKAFFKK